MSVKEKEIISTWDGAVCVDDRYFRDIEDAVEHYYDDLPWVPYDPENPGANDNISADQFAEMLLTIPEFLECCDSVSPHLGDCRIEDLIENIAQDNPVGDGGHDEQFCEAVGPDSRLELKKLIEGWIKSTGFVMWEGNYKYIPLRPLVKEYARQA